MQWVQQLYNVDRIHNAINIDRLWLILRDAGKPTDTRIKTVKKRDKHS